MVWRHAAAHCRTSPESCESCIISVETYKKTNALCNDSAKGVVYQSKTDGSVMRSTGRRHVAFDIRDETSDVISCQWRWQNDPIIAV